MTEIYYNLTVQLEYVPLLLSSQMPEQRAVFHARVG